MPLEIVLGRAGSGKSSYCISKIAEAAKSGERAIYIVPEQFSHEAESELIKSVGYISDRILATSFKRLSFSVLESCGRAGIYADNRIKSMLMAKVLLEIGQELKVFAGLSRNSGFIECLLDVISEFKKAVLSPQDILAVAGKITDNDFLKQKMTELGLIYDRYAKSYSGGFCDSQDSITAASECVGKSRKFEGSHVYIDEFFRFTKQEILFIKALLCEKVNVTVAFSGDRDNSGGVFDPGMETSERLQGLCKSVGDVFLGYKLLEGSKRFSSAEIMHLEREFSSYPPKKYEKNTEDISLYVAPDINSEITHLASKINKLVKTEGYSYSEISIIAGNFDRYRDILGTVFSDYEIPVFIDDKRSLLSHPVMLMLFSVFDIITDGFNTKDVLAYIKTGLSKVSDIEADILENHVIKSGIRNSDWVDDERFSLRAKSVFDTENELTEEERAQLTAIKNKVVEPLVTLKSRLSLSRKVKSRIKALTDFFEETELFEKVSEISKMLEKSGDRKRAEEFASVYSILGETLTQAAEFLGESSMGLERLKAVLWAGFGELSVGVVPTEYDQVFFGDENRSVVKNVRVLFVIGANSGAFPADVAAGGIFTDSERLFLQNQGFELAPTTEKRVLDSRFSVYNVLAIPKEKLYLSYSLSDIEGKGLRPSQVIASIKRIFPSLSASYGNLSGEIPEEFIMGKKSAFNYVVSKMASESENVLTAKLKEELLKNEDFAQRLKNVEERIKADMRAERLSRASVDGLYGKKLTGSVSRFEKFSQCPFSYFVQYGLKAKERKAISPEATDTGSLLHSVIEIFSKRVYDNGRKFSELTDNEATELISDIIDELVFGSFIEKLYSKNKLSSFVRRLKSLASRSAIAICEHVRRGEFTPCAFEFSFDENGDTPPIHLTLPDGSELSIVGKIDRVDSYTYGDKVYIKIIDYKSGQKKFSLSDIYNRTSLQLTVYLMAYLSQSENNMPAGMFYFRLTDPVTDGFKSVGDESLKEEIIKKYKMSGLVLSDSEIVDAMERGKTGYFSTIPVMKKKDGGFSEKMSSCANYEDFNTLTSYVNQALCDIGGEIFSGNVDILPQKNGKNTACDYCEFGSVCGAGKYFDVEYRNALAVDKAEAFCEMRKAMGEEE